MTVIWFLAWGLAAVASAALAAAFIFSWTMRLLFAADGPSGEMLSDKAWLSASVARRLQEHQASAQDELARQRRLIRAFAIGQADAARPA